MYRLYKRLEKETLHWWFSPFLVVVDTLEINFQVARYGQKISKFSQTRRNCTDTKCLNDRPRKLIIFFLDKIRIFQILYVFCEWETRTMENISQTKGTKFLIFLWKFMSSRARIKAKTTKFLAERNLCTEKKKKIFIQNRWIDQFL